MTATSPPLRLGLTGGIGSGKSTVGHMLQARGATVVMVAYRNAAGNVSGIDFVPSTGSVTLWQPRHGGHVGFASGRWPGQVRSLSDRVGGWLLKAAGVPAEESVCG